MLPGVYQAKKKDGTIYYRSSITYMNKHISLGSFALEREAHEAYCEAAGLLDGEGTLEEILEEFTYRDGERGGEPAENTSGDGNAQMRRLAFGKCITLLNFRDHRMYIPTPIYMRKNYFSYFLTPREELKFDIDDLFYYSQHKIMRRQGHLFVNDYGMQVTIMSRFGIKSHSVCHRDYEFANGDSSDLRYSNVIVINRYYGVDVFEKKGRKHYRVKIHINGSYTVGVYEEEEMAAVAYNKAADLAREAGVCRNYPQNYIESLSGGEYVRLYMSVRLSKKYLDYLDTLTGGRK